MKKMMLGLVMAMAVSATAFAGGYNPFHNAYEAAAHYERTPGKAQLVYVVVDENKAPLANATVNYFDNQGVKHNVTTDNEGKARLVFTEGKAYVQISSVTIGGNELSAIGDDTTEDVDYEDIREGEVKYNVLQKAPAKNIVYIYDAD